MSEISTEVITVGENHHRRPWGLHSVTRPGRESGLVLVVCSFDPDMDPVFDAIVGAAAAVGLRAARLVVADLSHERPNVYWFEVGRRVPGTDEFRGAGPSKGTKPMTGDGYKETR